MSTPIFVNYISITITKVINIKVVIIFGKKRSYFFLEIHLINIVNSVINIAHS